MQMPSAAKVFSSPLLHRLPHGQFVRFSLIFYSSGIINCLWLLILVVADAKACSSVLIKKHTLFLGTGRYCRCLDQEVANAKPFQFDLLQ